MFPAQMDGVHCAPFMCAGNIFLSHTVECSLLKDIYLIRLRNTFQGKVGYSSGTEASLSLSLNAPDLVKQNIFLDMEEGYVFCLVICIVLTQMNTIQKDMSIRR